MTDSPDLSRHWTLDPAIDFLNHGSFGACPRVVLEAQAELRARMEREPVRFLARELEGLLDAARGEVAAFLGADPEDLAFVPNATAGVNTVLRSLSLEPGDELLVSDQEYNASRNALEYVAARSGARTVVAAVPFPLTSPDQVLEALQERAGGRTRLLLVDHVTSPTGLVNPIDRIVRAFEGRGIPVLVDGAHAPGMIELDLTALGASFYTGNCHKWLCAPKGAAVLHVRHDRQEGLVPLAISHGWNDARGERSRFRKLFDWGGTDDPTPFLCIPESIRFLAGLLPGGFAELRARNHALALEARALLCRALAIAPPAPEAMLGSLAAVPLPDGERPGSARLFDADPLQRELFDKERIEVPVFAWPKPPRRLLRVSAQIYNRRAQYERLAAALAQRFQ